MIPPVKMNGTKKRRHVSKKSKTSWRKNVDIQDVEDYLEDQRLEERLGSFASKPDDELFIIDSQPSAKSIKSAEGKAKVGTRRAKKLLSLPVNPHCFQALENTSKVQDPSGKRNHVKPVKLSEKTEAKKMAKGIYKKKLDMAKKNRDLANKKRRDLKASHSEFKQDLWGEEALTPEVPRPKSEWLTLDTSNCNKLAIRPSRPPRRTPRAPPIVPPHPGLSYNPGYKDHQELLQNVVREELKIIKEEKHLIRVTSGMFRKVTPAQKKAEDLAQRKQGLIDPSAPDLDASDGEYKTINPPVLNKKKDLKKRRNMRDQNKAKSAAKALALEKKKLSDIYKLRQLKNEIEKNETTNATLRATRATKLATNPPLPRLSKRRFKEPDSAFPAMEDITGDLRCLKPQGGGLIDRFTSLQRRGLAPVSSPVTLKKAKMKRYKLSSHRLPWEQTETPIKPSKRISKE